MLISSSSNPKIQRVRGLLTRRQDRMEQHSFVIEGVRLVEEALIAGWTPEWVFYTNQVSERGMEIVNVFRARGTDVFEIAPAILNQVTETDSPQGLLAIFQQRELPVPNKPDFLLVADNIRDPGNLGTLLRSATAAGVQAVLLTPGTTDAFSPKVLRAGMGAHFRLPVLNRTWDAITTLIHHNQLAVILAEASVGTTCWDLNLCAPLALIIGSEADGPSQMSRFLATHTITIPMPGKSESLNAAIAASILLFEIVRQRRQQYGL